MASSYLMADGDVRPWRPRTFSVYTTDEESMTNECQLVCSHTPDSFFLTGPDNYYNTSIKTPSESLHFLGWQPLIKSSLLEHTRVSEVYTLKAMYIHNMLRRQDQLWKPQELL